MTWTNEFSKVLATLKSGTGGLIAACAAFKPLLRQRIRG
jgi:hypothetical protein